MGDYIGDNGPDGAGEIDESAATQPDIPAEDVQQTIEEQGKKQIPTQELRALFGGMSPSDIKYLGMIDKQGGDIQRFYRVMQFPGLNLVDRDFVDYIFVDKYLAILDYLIRSNTKEVFEIYKKHSWYEKGDENPPISLGLSDDIDDAGLLKKEADLSELVGSDPISASKKIMEKIREVEPRYILLQEAEEQRVDPTEYERGKVERKISNEECDRLLDYGKFKEEIIGLDKECFENELQKLKTAKMVGNMLESPAEAMVYYMNFWEFLTQPILKYFQNIGKFEDDRFHLLSCIGEEIFKLKFGKEPPKSLKRKNGKYDLDRLFTRIDPPEEGEEVTPFYTSMDSLPKAFRRLELLRKSMNALAEIISDEKKDSLQMSKEDLDGLVDRIKRLGTSMQDVSDRVGESEPAQILETYDKGQEASVNLGIVYDALGIERGEPIDKVVKRLTELNKESKILDQKDAQIDQLAQKNQRLEDENNGLRKNYKRAKITLTKLIAAVNAKLGGI